MRLRLLVAAHPIAYGAYVPTCLHNLRVECEPVWYVEPLTVLAKTTDVFQRRNR
jgi:hypothetical protein